MDNFDLKKYLAENQLTPNSVMMYRETSVILDEGVLQDLADKVKPALNKIFSIGKSKSKQAYDIVKKEVTDPKHAEKALATAEKAYNGVKNIADKATNDPNKLKDLSKFIPSLKNTFIGGAIGSVYKLIAGASLESGGWFSAPDINWGDPSTIIMVAKFLVALKLLIYALQAIANIRKGADAAKGIFTEDEENEEMEDVNFNDIEDLFEYKNEV